MKYFYIFTSLLLIIPFISGLIKFERLNSHLRIIFYLISFGLFTNILMIFFGIVYKNNIWLGHIYTIVEFFLISFFFLNLFDKPIFKRIISILISIFVVIVFINKIYLEQIQKIDNYSLTISAILLLVISSMYLVEYISKNMLIDVKSYQFLLTIGFMIYFGGDLFIFALSNEIKGIWIVHNLISTLLTLIYTLVFLWQK